jgi:bacterioferritin
MKGNPTVLEHLNQALRDELTAINQYFLHAEMSENWGYKKYSKYIKRQSIDEMKHAEILMERILFLDGIPKMEPMSLTIGKSVKEMIESDLALEHMPSLPTTSRSACALKMPTMARATSS